MKRKLLLTAILFLSIPLQGFCYTFVPKRKDYAKYEQRSDVVVVASPGRSGSTMLTCVLEKYVPVNSVLKTHLLPPSGDFQGKILFIYSNPDKAAESAFHCSLTDYPFVFYHLLYVETSDKEWLNPIGKSANQTKEYNLLACDAFGWYEHLNEWLHIRTEEASREEAQIFAVKYEHLWEEETIQEMMDFLDMNTFSLPPQIVRGAKPKELSKKEAEIREMYNLGTEKDPRYAAYKDARILWEAAPPFQYLKIHS